MNVVTRNNFQQNGLELHRLAAEKGNEKKFPISINPNLIRVVELYLTRTILLLNLTGLSENVGTQLALRNMQSDIYYQRKELDNKYLYLANQYKWYSWHGYRKTKCNSCDICCRFA